MKSLLRLLGLFRCSGGSGFVRMNAGVMFAWLTKLKEIGNGCGCLSLVRIGWEGFDLPPVSLCERVEAFPHPDPAVACAVAFVVQQTRRRRLSLGGCAAKHTNRAKRFY